MKTPFFTFIPLLSLLSSVSTAQVTIEVKAVTGQSLPDRGAATIGSVETPLISKNGQHLAFTGIISAAPDFPGAAFRHTGGNLSVFAVQGEPTASGPVPSAPENLKVDNEGNAAFNFTEVEQGIGDSWKGLWQNTTGTLAPISRPNQAVPGGLAGEFLRSMDIPGISSSGGHVIFPATILQPGETDFGAAEWGLFMRSGGMTRMLQRTAFNDRSLCQFCDYFVNSSGQAVFDGPELIAGNYLEVIWHWDGTALRRIIKQGDALPGATAAFSNGSARILESGHAIVRGIFNTGTSQTGLWRWDGTALSLIMKSPDFVLQPAGNVRLSSIWAYAGNNAGAITVLCSDTSGGGLWHHEGGVTVPLVRIGTPLPGGGSISSLNNITRYSLTESGRVAVHVNFGFNNSALYLFDGYETKKLLGSGDAVTVAPGSTKTIRNVSVAGGRTALSGSTSEGSFLAEDGSVVCKAEFTDSSQAILSISSAPAPYSVWAASQGLNAGNGAPTADPDNDGNDNQTEFQDSTIPTQAASVVPRLILSSNGTGTVAAAPAKATYAYGESVVITATPAAPYEFLGWSGDATGTNSSITVTMTRTQRILAGFTYDLAPAVGATGFPFSTGGDARWYAQQQVVWTNGQDTLSSGPIGHNQSSWVETTVNGPGTLYFLWKVSSQSGGDYLEFWLDGVRHSRISGSTSWAEPTVAVTGGGSHICRWVYTKNSSVVSGSDAGYLDAFRWLPTDGFASWTAAAGLTGTNSQPLSAPRGDGVANLLKYAFNMNASAADSRLLTPGTGTAGLPVTTVQGTPAAPVLRMEFLRRKGSGLTYTPRKTASVSAGPWLALSDTPTVTSIDATWERVVYEELVTGTRWFARVEVVLP